MYTHGYLSMTCVHIMHTNTLHIHVHLYTTYTHTHYTYKYTQHIHLHTTHTPTHNIYSYILQSPQRVYFALFFVITIPISRSGTSISAWMFNKEYVYGCFTSLLRCLQRTWYDWDWDRHCAYKYDIDIYSHKHINIYMYTYILMCMCMHATHEPGTNYVLI